MTQRKWSQARLIRNEVQRRVTAALLSSVFINVKFHSVMIVFITDECVHLQCIRVYRCVSLHLYIGAAVQTALSFNTLAGLTRHTH